MAKNIFVVGLDDFNLQQLRSIHNAGDYEFFGLIPYPDIVNPAEYRVPEMIDAATRELADFPGTIEAIIGHWDFPTTSLLPILRSGAGLPTPSLESILKCEHKYLSRLEQQVAIPDAVPRFCQVDPFADGASNIPLSFPFWLKPSIAFSSYLGYRISSKAVLDEALATIRANIGTFAEPFNQIMAYAESPSDDVAINGYQCIAEELISGRLCTVEGYVHRGEPHCYAIIDSIRTSNRSSFSRYQYPSSLPVPIRERVVRLAEKVAIHLGLDCTPFNMEFFWNPRLDRIFLLEINPRISQSHAPLFQMVAGASHHEVAIDVAMGRKPDFPQERGKFRHAAKFMPRVFRDAIVTRVPSRARIREIEERYGGAQINLNVREGMRLSTLRNQDAYSYEIATVFLGSHSQKSLLRNYRALMEDLDLQLGPVLQAPRAA